jgi:hypothetical protein
LALDRAAANGLYRRAAAHDDAVTGQQGVHGSRVTSAKTLRYRPAHPIGAGRAAPDNPFWQPASEAPAWAAGARPGRASHAWHRRAAMVSTWDEDLALRMQAEHKACMELCQALREHIAATTGAPEATWLDGLRAEFTRLLTYIQQTIALKVKDGYLEAILRERPTLARQVESIKSEHKQLLCLGESIRNDLAEVRTQDRLLVADACARVLRFVAVLAQHEQRENMIVLFAFNQDLGAD